MNPMWSEDSENLIEFRSVSLKFPFGTNSRSWAIRDVSFVIQQGESFGLVGENGAGKSTILRLAAGILNPCSGRVNTAVTCHSLFGTGTGFQHELTGRENIYLYAAFMGVTDARVNDSIQRICDFSGLGEAVDQPVFTYSRGMRSRLGFSVVSELDPEFLILDEVFSAGDQSFRSKSRRRMEELITNCRGVMIASHNSALLREMCTHGIWLESGRIKSIGPIDDVLDEYEYSEDWC